METNTPKEGKTTVAIEKKTSRIPSGVYLTAALASMATSLVLKCCRKNSAALFVGQWAAPFLLMGLYNKIVKMHGHDKYHHNPGEPMNSSYDNNNYGEEEESGRM